mgnify:FL=1
MCCVIEPPCLLFSLLVQHMNAFSGTLFLHEPGNWFPFLISSSLMCIQISRRMSPEYVVRGLYLQSCNAMLMEIMFCSLLEERLHFHPTPSVPLVLWWCLQCSLAVKHVHDCDLVHRDIKPGNFLVSESGLQIKLSDFGLSRTFSQPPTGDGSSVAELGTALFPRV